MGQNPSPGIIQELQAELRAARVEAQRHRLELEEIRGRHGKPDPRLERLENELRRLREELASVRAERDELLAGLRAAVAQLEKA